MKIAVRTLPVFAAVAIGCFGLILWSVVSLAQNSQSPLQRAAEIQRAERTILIALEKAAKRAESAARSAFRAAEEARKAAREVRRAFQGSQNDARKMQLFSTGKRIPAVPERSQTTPRPTPNISKILKHGSPTSPQEQPPKQMDVSVPKGSILSTIAALMKPGEWRQVSTDNINVTLGAKGSSGIVFGFTDNIQWDPITRRLFYMGGDHGDDKWFIIYDEFTNKWRRIGTRHKYGHGYDHGAIDPKGRKYFYRPFRSDVIERYDIESGQWDTLPSLKGKVRYRNCCVAIAYFPELRGLIHVALEARSGAAALLWESQSNKWRRLGDGFPIGGLHNFAEYNPIHRMVLFGGGNAPNSKAMHRIGRTGEVTRLGNAPVPLGIQQSIVTVDPVGGEFLVFTNRSEFYAYDVTSDRWRLINVPVPIWSRAYKNPVHGVVATPLSNYGVNLFVSCKKPRSCFVYLYRHSEPIKSAD